MSEKFVTRWRLEVSARPVLPGVWRLKGGGFVASAQVPDPTQRRIEGERPRYKTLFSVMRHAATAREAMAWLDGERERVRLTDPLLLQIPRWKDYAVSVCEKKILGGDLASAASVHGFKNRLKRIIETAAWADLPIDEIRHAHLQDWRDLLPTLTYDRGSTSSLATGAYPDGPQYGPRTLNAWLGTAGIVWAAATLHYELRRNPFEGIKLFTTKLAKTYTREEPNSLNPRTEVPEFLQRFQARYPELYCFVLMGFVLGQRPSRFGPCAAGGRTPTCTSTRRSSTSGGRTRWGRPSWRRRRRGTSLSLSLPDELVDVIKEHIAALDQTPVRKCDLLFPARTGGLLSTHCFATRSPPS